MANEEVLGPRKTMFVIVIVVGCFAVLWPRILSPLILGHARDQLKPNQFDREAGCCEVMFETEVAVLELINEVCSSVVQVNGKLSPFAAAECRKAVNETCGVDIAAFLKRDENVGKTTKKLLDTMKSSNSSCLKEHFGVAQWSVSSHTAMNSWTLPDTVKQERPPMRAGPHPALRERGRAIPAGTPAPPPRGAVPMPPHVRVRSSPLDVYFELDIKPPPIPGMRPPLGSPGGPVPSPKSSMGFVMPIYTICIIVFFVYTLSKILFKRTGSYPYEPVTPDPQFRRRVFRDDSRTSPDKLGPKERDTIVTAISGLVAEVQQQMEASYAQNQQRQDLQDNNARPYTNGTILHNSGPVHIVASEYRERSREKSPQPSTEEVPSPEEKEPSPEEVVPTTEKEPSPEAKESSPEAKESSSEVNESSPEEKAASQEEKEPSPGKENDQKPAETKENETRQANEDLIKLIENIESVKDDFAKSTIEFLKDAREVRPSLEGDEHKTTPELLEEALKEDSSEKESDDGTQDEEEEKGSVKVLGMETTAHTADGGELPPPALRPPPPPPPSAPARPPHEAEEVKAIYLEGDIPQQSRVLVAEFEDRADRPAPTKHSPMVVSGKMTLSLIQDPPRDTPDRELESTVDEFTTASAITQPAAEKDDESEEEIEEEIEVEEIEEEIEEVEEVEEDEEEEEDKQAASKAAGRGNAVDKEEEEDKQAAIKAAGRDNAVEK